MPAFSVPQVVAGLHGFLYLSEGRSVRKSTSVPSKSDGLKWSNIFVTPAVDIVESPSPSVTMWLPSSRPRKELDLMCFWLPNMEDTVFFQ